MPRDSQPQPNSRRKGSGREESKRRTRQQLLDAALTIFAREGFHAARLDDVAREAGLTKGAVYSNFASKEALFLALYDHRVEQITPQMVGAFDRPAPERFRAIAGVLEDAAPTDTPWVRLELEFVLFALRDESARAKLAERQRWIRSALRTALEGDAGAGAEMPAGVLDVLSWTLPALTLALNMQASIVPAERPADLWPTLLFKLLGRAPGSGPSERGSE